MAAGDRAAAVRAQPAPLLLLIAATSDASGEPAGWAIATGIAAVLVMVVAGLLLMVRDLRLKEYEDIDEGEFVLGPQVRSFAEQLVRDRRRTVGIASATAILLWILCALPVVLVSLLSESDSFAPLFGVSLTLVMVAAGLAIKTGAGWSDTATGKLLQEPDEDRDDPEHSDSLVIRAIAAVYWPVMAAIYLAWSFLTGDWEISWVIWPVAGVLYAGLSSLNVALRREDPSTERRARRR